MDLTRRLVLAGLATAACSGLPIEVEDEGGLAASDPEDDEMSVPAAFTKPPTTPIHLTASTTLSANSSGGVNAISLKNPTSEAMEILEIKWQLAASSLSGLSVTAINFGTVIACKLDLGKFAVTNGFIPVSMFCRSEGLISEQMSSFGAASFGAVCNEYVWKLPHPLYVPKGAVLVPTFQHRGLVANEVNVRVSFAARSIPPGTPAPKKVSLPYAAAWGADTFDASVAGTDVSSETDLVNPFDEPIHIQRMVGRVLNTQGNTLDEQCSIRSETIVALTNIRMVDSSGRPVIRRYVPFRLAFSGETRSWEMAPGTMMDPKSFFTAYIRKDASALYAANTNFTQAFVSIVGWRDVVGGGAL